MVRQKNNDRTEPPELHVIRGALWYVFPEIKNCVENIHSRTRPGDLLCVSQNFPPLESEFIGKDVLPNPDAVQAAFDDYFEIHQSIWMQNHTSKGNDNWFVALFYAR